MGVGGTMHCWQNCSQLLSNLFLVKKVTDVRGAFSMLIQNTQTSNIPHVTHRLLVEQTRAHYHSQILVSGASFWELFIQDL